MTNTGKIITAGIVGAVAVFALVTLVDVDVSGDLEVPSVEMTGGDIELPTVETSGGEMPEVEVDGPSVDVRETNATVDVPTDVNVETEEREVPGIPEVDVTLPEEETEADTDPNTTRMNSQ